MKTSGVTLGSAAGLTRVTGFALRILQITGVTGGDGVSGESRFHPFGQFLDSEGAVAEPGSGPHAVRTDTVAPPSRSSSAETSSTIATTFTGDAARGSSPTLAGVGPQNRQRAFPCGQ